MRRMSSSWQYFQAPYSPGTMIFAGGLVADLHVVDAGLDAGVVDGLDYLSSNWWLFINPPSRMVQSSTLISGR